MLGVVFHDSWQYFGSKKAFPYMYMKNKLYTQYFTVLKYVKEIEDNSIVALLNP